MVHPHRHALTADDVVDGIVTSKELTLAQCLRSLPDDEALTIADSAARAGELAMLARDARRYDLLIVDGWILLRFAARRRTKPVCGRCGAA